ncbi:uncharacterized protein BKCO1_2600092 [Diplodia corticola]|uniref:Uncharacterized protein n=1 Tax=Diplodia corticola TaxID=236234 RepID=A0A1J9R0A6_9PEZI|nr:uncharacterized protein BKCO1_2600092 [Diplodia corticola]OJD34033.1 hypothetical protein BKCO1_2600092 [Diplodia corticola]
MHSSSPPITLPQFPDWVQQLAHILPLAVFVEFVDASLKLHGFQLNGLTPLWNWPITPKDARLLLSTEDSSAACYLDRANSPGHAALQCIDGRHGDCYQSNAPATVRLCVSKLHVAKTVLNPSRVFDGSPAATARMQKLDFVHVYPAAASSASSRVHKALFAHQQSSVRYCLTSMLGWLFWIALTCFAFLAEQYVGAVYLILMPLSGVLAVLTNSGEPRAISPSASPSSSSASSSAGPLSRLVLAADSLNATEWWGFYGGSDALNGLLRRPLYREAGLLPGLSRPVRLVLRVLILGQWVLALVACVKRDWNAFVVAFWVFWCAVASSSDVGGIYTPAHGVEDWLKYSCNVRMRRVQAVFSSRKAMLGALVYLNPDTVGRRLQWVNHFFEDGPERREWESALLDFIETGSCNDDDLRDQPCWAWIEEGVEMGKRIAAVMKQSEKGDCLAA